VFLSVVDIASATEVAVSLLSFSEFYEIVLFISGVVYCVRLGVLQVFTEVKMPKMNKIQ
jgi:hypothetical protein